MANGKEQMANGKEQMAKGKEVARGGRGEMQTAKVKAAVGSGSR